ncbi:MAG: trigger factor [Fusobacterium sp.]|nr:trigger factor [Fusobacterium sp.]
MTSNITKEKENIVKLELTIPAKDAQAAYENAVKLYSQYVSIPGFRKGKAPKNMVERQVGSERLQQEALDKLLPRFIDEAVKENKLDIVTQPELTNIKFELGKDVEATVKLELKPELTVGEYKNLTVDVEDAVIAADAVDKAIERLQNQYAEVVTVTEPRNAKETDIVVIDFDGSANGEKIKGGAGQNYNLDLAHSNFIPGFAEGIVGKPMNEEFDVNVTFPEEYHEESLKGQPAVFKVTVKEIKERNLPEVNAEFAKKVGGFDSVDALKEDIKKHLEAQREAANLQNAENVIFGKVMDSVKVEIPESMVKREFEALKAEYSERFSMQGLSLENVFKAQGQDYEKVLTEEAESRIKNTLLIDKIAKDEEIKLTPADIQVKLQELSSMYGVEPQTLMQQFSSNPGVLSAISQQAVNDKVRKFLVDNNKVNYVVSSK